MPNRFIPSGSKNYVIKWKPLRSSPYIYHVSININSIIYKLFFINKATFIIPVEIALWDQV